MKRHPIWKYSTCLSTFAKVHSWRLCAILLPRPGGRACNRPLKNSRFGVHFREANESYLVREHFLANQVDVSTGEIPLRAHPLLTNLQKRKIFLAPSLPKYRQRGSVLVSNDVLKVNLPAWIDRVARELKILTIANDLQSKALSRRDRWIGSEWTEVLFSMLNFTNQRWLCWQYMVIHGKTWLVNTLQYMGYAWKYYLC